MFKLLKSTVEKQWTQPMVSENALTQEGKEKTSYAEKHCLLKTLELEKNC